jgi:hypothetical protein
MVNCSIPWDLRPERAKGLIGKLEVEDTGLLGCDAVSLV